MQGDLTMHQHHSEGFWAPAQLTHYHTHLLAWLFSAVQKFLAVREGRSCEVKSLEAESLYEKLVMESFATTSTSQKAVVSHSTDLADGPSAWRVYDQVSGSEDT